MPTPDPYQPVVLIHASNSNESVVRYRDYLANACTAFAFNRVADSFRAGPLAPPPLLSEGGAHQ